MVVHGENHGVVGLAKPSLEARVFWSFSPFDFFFFLTLIFCNFLEMMMCQNEIEGCKMFFFCILKGAKGLSIIYYLKKKLFIYFIFSQHFPATLWD